MTVGSFIKHQFMGTQGKRNLAFVRAKGRHYMPGVTRKIEGRVRQGKKWVNQLAGIARAGTEVMDAAQRTDLPGMVEGVERGVKRSIGLGKEIASDPGVRRAAKRVKTGVQGLLGKRKRTFAASDMEQRPKTARISPNDIARLSKSVSPV